MPKYEVKFKIKTTGSIQKQVVDARTQYDARKLIKAQYGTAFKGITGVKKLKK